MILPAGLGNIIDDEDAVRAPVVAGGYTLKPWVFYDKIPKYILQNLSWPAVSQNWSLIFFPRQFIVLILKSIPKVGVKVELKDPSSEKLKRMLVLPTPESPIKSNLKRRS